MFGYITKRENKTGERLDYQMCDVAREKPKEEEFQKKKKDIQHTKLDKIYKDIPVVKKIQIEPR